AWLIIHGGVLYSSLAVMYVIWFGAVVELARRTSASFTESVRLRFENRGLVENLQREKIAAEQANAAKSRFLAAASHDLRQPVHALSLFVAAMRPRTMDDRARDGRSVRRPARYLTTGRGRRRSEPRTGCRAAAARARVSRLRSAGERQG